MREMKDSGNVWYGKIPYTWELNKIKYLTTIRSESAIYNPEEDKYIGLENVNGYSDNVVETDTEYDYSMQSICKKDDILFSKLRPYLAKVFIAKHNSFCTGEFIVFSSFNGDRRYLFYSILNPKFIENINSSTYGAKMPRANPQYIFDQQICLPPLDEQQRIAEFLDRECGKIDGLKADIQAQIDTLEQYKRSVITEAVTHGLNPSAPMKECSVSWARQIPQHWKVMPNKHLMTKIKNICPIYKGEDILSLTMYGVIVRDLDAGGKMPSSFDGYQYIKKGNLLMCLFDIDVTPRCIGIIKQNGITSPAYSQFKMKKIANARFYYYYYLMLDYTKELLHLAKNLRHSLTEDQLGAIKQLVPPLDEQQEIADYLDNKCAEIEQIIADKKSQIETLDGFKKSLIYEYVTGKKEVE
ncbi:MAG: restriction endonuclease subunit S [Lachnospiraceae bacterium]|nr:restriction endonuclease subunit S [Lachnospiraceae bacterium]